MPMQWLVNKIKRDMERKGVPQKRADRIARAKVYGPNGIEKRRKVAKPWMHSAH